MRPLDLFDVHLRVQKLFRPCVFLLCAWLATGCCQTSNSGSAPADAAPASSSSSTAEAPPPPFSTAFIAAPSGSSSVSPAVPEAPSAAPVRQIAAASHILVAYKGAELAPKTITRTKDQARKRAEEALAELRKDESKFAALVKKYTDDEFSKGTEGRLGNFERNAMPAAFSDTVFAMMIDTTSGVVETPRGFHIIRRTK